MKKIFLTISLCFLYQLSSSQIVLFNDPDFKQRILFNYSNLDANFNNEIEVSEALTLTEMEIGGLDISDLTGLEAFQNLTFLKLEDLSVTDLNVNALVNLTDLWLINVTATNYPLSNVTQLTSLIIYNSPVPNLDISNLTNLEILNINSGNLTSLNLTNLINLKQLATHNNAAFPISFPNPNTIERYFCVNTELSQINLTGFTALNYLNCSNNPFTSLTIANNQTLDTIVCQNINLPSIALFNLPSLKRLDCSNGQLSSLDISTIPSLEILNCSENNITSINLSNSGALKELYCQNNEINAFNFTNLGQLVHLTCKDNPAPLLDFLGLNSLKYLTFGSPQLSQINSIDALTELDFFNMYNTTLTQVDLSPLQNVTRLGIHNTPLTSIDFSTNSKVRFINFDYNAQLTYLNANNGLRIIGLLTGTSYIYYSPNLNKVCTAPFNIADFTTILTNSNYFNSVQNPLVLPYCDFNSGNRLTGTVRYDGNGNGCDPTDSVVSNVPVQVISGATTFATFTDGFGNYQLYPSAGQYTASVAVDPNYFFINPNSATFNWNNTNLNAYIQDFCISPNGIKNDLEVTLVPSTEVRPGIQVAYQIVFKNKGNQPLSGTLTLNYDDAVMDLQNAGTTNPYTNTTNTLSWSYSNLLPFESRSLFATFQFNTPTQNPPLNLGDVLTFSVTGTPTNNDLTPNNNTFTLIQTIVNSFDPNDKTCLEGAAISTQKVGDYLHYRIRFQNEGNAPAVNVAINDVINTSMFDVSTLQIIGSSHSMRTERYNNSVSFIFDEINLPPMTQNETASQGYVAFKIKTLTNLVLNDVITNTGAIYFDFNYPIITNTATTTVTALNTNIFLANQLQIAPNPTRDRITIDSKLALLEISLYDLQGRQISVQNTQGSTAVVDFSNRENGIYLLKINTDQGTATYKIVKE